MGAPLYTHMTFPLPGVGDFLIPPEPVDGSVVLDSEGRTWSRVGDFWFSRQDLKEKSETGMDWDDLFFSCGPLKLGRWGR